MASAAPTPAAEDASAGNDAAFGVAATEGAPEAAPATIDFSSLEADVADVFGFGDSSSQPPAAGTAASEPGVGAGQAPSPTPVAPEAAPAPTPSPAPAAPQPTPTPAPATPLAAPSAPAPAAPPTPEEAALRTASLEATVAALTSQLQQLQANPSATGTQPATPAAPGPDAAVADYQPPAYNLSLPEQVTSALTGDDPQQANQAIHWIVNSLATVVHRNLGIEYRKHFDDRVNALVAEAGQTDAERNQQAQIERYRNDYYAKFPDHNNPLIQPIVAMEAGKLSAQYPHLPWNDDYMNSLGTRVNAAVATLRGGAQPAAPTPTPVPVPAPRPAGMLPASGPTPMVPAGGGEGSQEDLMFSTMQEGNFFA